MKTRVGIVAAAVITSAVAMAQTPSIETTARKLRADWENCVRLSAQIWSPTPAANDIMIGPAETGFRNCATEEQLIVILAQSVSPD